jgi:hypothetical protein
MPPDLREHHDGPSSDDAFDGADRPELRAPDWSTIPVPAHLSRLWAERLTDARDGSPERERVAWRREVELLAAATPGPALGAWLDAVDPESLTDAGVVEAAAAAARVEAAAHARTARCAGAGARLPDMDPRWSGLAGPPPLQHSVAGDELAFKLGTSRLAANALVRQGIALSTHMQATGEALQHGDLDAVKTRVLVDRLWDEPHELVHEVERRVLPTAARRTVTELRRDIEHALLEVDPEGAPGRVERARSGRRVSHPRVLPDGMASMSVVLAAQDAARVDGVLDRAARAARSCGDPRTLDQLCVDGLRDLVAGSEAAAGDGPCWSVDGLTVRHGDRAAHADLYRAVPWADAVAQVAPSGQAVDPDPDARTDSAAATDPPVPVSAAVREHRQGSGPRPGAQIRVTVAASTLLGMDDQPADLDGYGPIDAVTARTLAASGVWQRVVTDPLSGTVLDLGRTRYRPTAALAEHVRVRDRRCVAPGCVVPATHADLDHTRPYHAPPRPPGLPWRSVEEPLGTTADYNLGPLCRRHHRLKTDGGFVLRQVRPGAFEWTSPTGHRYLVRPGTGEVVDLTTAGLDEPPPF